jgi:hypothetical protein
LDARIDERHAEEPCGCLARSTSRAAPVYI